MSSMTYEQAVERAIRLKNEGLTYPKIEEILKKNGYTSPRTKRAVSALAVRHMVTRAKEKQDTLMHSDAIRPDPTPKVEPSVVSVKLPINPAPTPEQELSRATKAILNSYEISTEIKNFLIIQLVNNSKELLK